MIPAYRVFRIGKHDGPATLFHGWWGSKTLPLDMELEAQVRPVTNPGKAESGRLFFSGWHVVPERKDIAGYLKRFKRPEELVVCKVYVSGVRDKPGSKVLLADKMVIYSKDWTNACSSHRRKYSSSRATSRRATRSVGSSLAAG